MYSTFSQSMRMSVYTDGHQTHSFQVIKNIRKQKLCKKVNLFPASIFISSSQTHCSKCLFTVHLNKQTTAIT